MISFISVFPPYRGGIAKFSHYLYRELTKETEVRAFNYARLYPPLLFPGKSQKEQNQRESYAFPLLHSYNPFTWGYAAKAISRHQSDFLIYSHWHPFFAPSTVRVISRIKKLNPETKTIGLFHNIAPHEYFPFQHYLIDSLIGKTDFPVVLSQQTNDEFITLHPDRKPLKLFHPVYEQPIPDIAKEKLREEYKFDKNDFILIFFGLIRNYKGLDLLIDALNQIDLNKYHIRPLIVGEFYIQKKPILDRIAEEHRDLYTFVDRFVTDEEAARYLYLSDAMVLPYRSASQSGVLTNAINFRLPVIVSNLKGLVEHIEDGSNGLIFEKENARLLKDAILKMTDKALRTKLSTNMEELKEELTWTRFCQKLLGETGYNK